MTRHTLHCSAPDHAALKDQPGWSDVLGEAELPDGVDPTPQLGSYLCGACGDAVARAKSRRRVVPPAQALAIVARAIVALSEGQAVSKDDLELLAEVGQA